MFSTIHVDTINLQRMVANKDSERRASVVLRTEVRENARENPKPDAGRHSGQPAKPRRDRPDTETLPKRYTYFYSSQ